MRGKPILCTVVLLAAAYAAYPYVALYRLETAIRSGDPDRIAAMVDWNQVRQGLKDDIDAQVIDSPPDPPEQPVGHAQDAVAALPPFGSSFLKGVASKAVDEAVSPDNVARMIRTGAVAEITEPDPVNAVSFEGARVTWAFFDGPESFALWLRTAAAGPDPVKLRMELCDGSWKITRIWLPPALLRRRG